ncbi:prophage protein [Citrobacter freundii]|nr:prophage protein [Citrobacter freundii]
MIKWLKPLALLVLVAFLMRWCFTEGVKRTDADWSLKWSMRDVADLTVTLQREVSERAEEQRRQKAADAEREQAEKELATMQANVDAADLAASGLRKQLSTLQRQLAGSETGRISALAAASAAKAEAASLLAQLLGEADAMAGEFAKEADERYVAGATCERTYDAVTKAKGKQ